jgi:hypothetical protein
MPPLPIIANTYRCALNWRDVATGQTAENVIHVRKASSSAMGIFTALDGSVSFDCWASVRNSCEVASVSITPLDGTSPTVEFVASGSQWIGAGGTGDLLPQVAALVKLTTATRGRSYRGRVFLPFTAEGITASGALDNTTVTALQTGWDNLLSTLSSTFTAKLVVASYRLQTAADVTAVLAERETGTQRKRQQRNR